MPGNEGRPRPALEMAAEDLHVRTADTVGLDPHQAIVRADHRPGELPDLEGAGTGLDHGPHGVRQVVMQTLSHRQSLLSGPRWPRAGWRGRCARRGRRPPPGSGR
ncbi:hypothetical protein ACFFX0_21905 [Citricoccus parietis]|uniref:Uncharacterized protein n=1 Tax=Citricoccus parietis TaxID=592307 RepID=A0ABV5G460_9MICC